MIDVHVEEARGHRDWPYATPRLPRTGKISASSRTLQNSMPAMRPTVQDARPPELAVFPKKVSLLAYVGR